MGLFGFLKSNFSDSVNTLDISLLSDVEFVKVFSHSVGCHYVQMTVLRFTGALLCVDLVPELLVFCSESHLL